MASNCTGSTQRVLSSNYGTLTRDFYRMLKSLDLQMVNEKPEHILYRHSRTYRKTHIKISVIDQAFLSSGDVTAGSWRSAEV